MGLYRNCNNQHNDQERASRRSTAWCSFPSSCRLHGAAYAHSHGMSPADLYDRKTLWTLLARFGDKADFANAGTLGGQNHSADIFITRAKIGANMNFRLRSQYRNLFQLQQQCGVIGKPRRCSSTNSPSASTAMTMFSGFVCVGTLDAFGNCDRNRMHNDRYCNQKDDQHDQHDVDERRRVDLGIQTRCHHHLRKRSSPFLFAPLRILISDTSTQRQSGVEIFREMTHFFHRDFVATNQPVVAKYRRNRHCQTDCSHDQRFADRAGHLIDTCLTGNDRSR